MKKAQCVTMPVKERKKPGPKPMSPDQRKVRGDEKRERYLEKRKEQRRRGKEKRKKIEEFLLAWERRRDGISADDLKDFFDLREFFPDTLNMETMERALNQQNDASPFGDLVKLLLTTIFALQVEEEEGKVDEEMDTENGTEIKRDKMRDDTSDQIRKAMVETQAYQYRGEFLHEVDLEPDTITEVLRLHLLSSVAAVVKGIQESNKNTFKNDHPELHIALQQKSIFYLEIKERLQLLHYLMSQVMSFSRFKKLTASVENALQKRKVTQAMLKQSKPTQPKVEKERSKPGPKPMSPDEKKEQLLARRKLVNDAKAEERKRIKDEKLEQEKSLKEWQKKRDDLECDDLKPIPPATPIKCDIPTEHFGDAIMVMEFFHNFEDLFELKEFFPYGIDFEILTLGLCDMTEDSPIVDFMRLLMSTVFALQVEEDTGLLYDVEMHDVNDDESSDHGSDSKDHEDEGDSERLTKAVSETYQHDYNGEPLFEVDLEPENIHEVLRLHLLSSGLPKQRIFQRGWYRAREDPGLLFRLDNPELMKTLASTIIYELTIEDRLKLLVCLINQVMTFTRFRNIIEETGDVLINLKKEVRLTQIEFSRLKRAEKQANLKETEQVEAKENEEKPETSAIPKGMTGRQAELAEKDKAEKQLKLAAQVQADRELKHQQNVAELNTKHRDLLKQIREAESYGIKPIGRDRAYRRYWSFSSMAGIFVEDDDNQTGDCLPIKSCTLYAKASFSKCSVQVSDFRKTSPPACSPSLSENSKASNKENETNLSEAPGSHKSEHSLQTEICTGDKSTCHVHNYEKNANRRKWCFYYQVSEINALIESLNNRGYRENHLKNELEKNKKFYMTSSKQCPAHLLNSSVTEEQVVDKNELVTKSNLVTSSKRGYTLRQRAVQKRTWAQRLAGLKARR